MYFQRHWRLSKDPRARSSSISTDPVLWIVFYTSWTGSNLRLFITNQISLVFHLRVSLSLFDRSKRDWFKADPQLDLSSFSFFPFLFFIAGADVSIFIENHRLIIRIVHFQAISRCFASVKVKKKISNFLSSNRSKSLSLCKYYNISFVTTTIRKVFLWYFLLKNLNLNSATVKEAIFIRRFVLYFVTKKIGRILAVQLYFFSRKKFTKILNNN